MQANSYIIKLESINSEDRLFRVETNDIWELAEALLRKPVLDYPDM